MPFHQRTLPLISFFSLAYDGYMDQSLNNQQNSATQSGFFAFLQKIVSYSSRKPLFFILILLIIPVTLLSVQQTVNYMSRAQTAGDDSVNISFSPASISLPGEQTVKIMFDSRSQPVVFARVVFSFDPNKVKLTSEITTSASLSTVVIKSTMEEANSQGKALMVIASPPNDTPPTGLFEFASFSVDAVSSDVGPTSVNFDPNDMQIVYSTPKEIVPVVTNLGINGPADTPPPYSSPTPFSNVDPNLISIRFSPPSVNLPPDSPLKIMVNNPAKPLGFARVVFTFDPSKIQLTSEITTNPDLSTVVDKSSMSQANSMGKAVIVIAASPSDVPPSGEIEFASFSIGAVSADIGQTVVEFIPSDMQLLDITGQNISPQTLNLSVNSSEVTPTFSVCGTIDACYQLWKQEFSGSVNTKQTDFNKDGNVNLIDFEILRRTAFP